MKTTARTMMMTAALAVAFLSAGAFAHGNGPVAIVQKANVTVIMKNSAWPVIDQAIPAACKTNRCIDA